MRQNFRARDSKIHAPGELHRPVTGTRGNPNLVDAALVYSCVPFFTLEKRTGTSAHGSTRGRVENQRNGCLAKQIQEFTRNQRVPSGSASGCCCAAIRKRVMVNSPLCFGFSARRGVVNIQVADVQVLQRLCACVELGLKDAWGLELSGSQSLVN